MNKILLFLAILTMIGLTGCTGCNPPAQLTVKIEAEGQKIDKGILIIPYGTEVVFTALVEGGKPPYRLEWLGPDDSVISNQEKLTISSFGCDLKGLYKIRVTDSDNNTTR